MRQDLFVLSNLKQELTHINSFNFVKQPYIFDWDNLLNTLEETKEFNNERKISIGDVLIANNLKDALLCLNFVPIKMAIQLSLFSFNRILKQTKSFKFDQANFVIKEWLVNNTMIDHKFLNSVSKKATHNIYKIFQYPTYESYLTSLAIQHIVEAVRVGNIILDDKYQTINDHEINSIKNEQLQTNLKEISIHRKEQLKLKKRETIEHLVSVLSCEILIKNNDKELDDTTYNQIKDILVLFPPHALA